MAGPIRFIHRSTVTGIKAQRQVVPCRAVALSDEETRTVQHRLSPDSVISGK